MADILLATLRPRANRTYTGLDNNGQTHMSDLEAMTVAGSFDGSDATRDAFSTGFDTDEGDSDVHVRWDLDICPSGLVISFLRWKARARVNFNANPGAASFILPTVDLSAPLGAAGAFFTSNTWLNYTEDTPVTPTSVAWTAAYINAHKLGWHIGCSFSEDPVGPSCEVTEIAVEVWGAPNNARQRRLMMGVG